jgi:hypothetical protein
MSFVRNGCAGKNTGTLKEAERMIVYYRPGLLILHDAVAKDSRSCPRIRNLTTDMNMIVARHKTKVVLFSRDQVRRAFFIDGNDRVSKTVGGHQHGKDGHGSGAADAMGEIERNEGRGHAKEALEDECGWAGEDCCRCKEAVGEMPVDRPLQPVAQPQRTQQPTRITPAFPKKPDNK